MPRLIFLNRFYWPDETATAQLLTDLAEALAARGCTVTVISSRPGGNRTPRSETRRGVRIERVGSTRSRGPRLAFKALDFATFYFGAMVRLARVARRGDRVIALSDPPLLGVGADLVAGIRGCPCFHWVQDIYPEVAIALTGRKGLRLFRPARNAAWRSARACIVLSREMADVLEESGVPGETIRVIPNWPPAGLALPSAESAAAKRIAWGVEGSFVVAYSGNLGRVHDLGIILDAAEAMRDDAGRTLFLFIGEGAQRPQLEAVALGRRLSLVRFLPSQPRLDLGASLAAGDVHVVSLLAGCQRYVFPSKLAALAAAGRPVLFIGPPDCEAARMVAEHGFGRAFSRADLAGIVGWLRELRDRPGALIPFGAAAAQCARSGDSLAAIAEKWERILLSR